MQIVIGLLLPQVQAVSQPFWNLKASDLFLVLASVITSAVMIWAVIQAPKWAVNIQWELQLRKVPSIQALAGKEISSKLVGRVTHGGLNRPGSLDFTRHYQGACQRGGQWRLAIVDAALDHYQKAVPEC
jgi:hypothetical protein